MSIEIVFETHALSEDNERGIATGWLPGRLSARAAPMQSGHRTSKPRRVLVSKEWLLHCYTKALEHDLRKVIWRYIADNLCLVILEPPP